MFPRAPLLDEVRALARRWDGLSERTMRGYQAFPELKGAIAENYKQGRFEGHDHAPQAADFAFIERVKAARQASGESDAGGEPPPAIGSK